MSDRMWQVAWIAAVIVGGAVWLQGGRATMELPTETVPIPMSPAFPAGEPPPGELITVHVTGAVARPGLVVVPAPARVADAIAATGGVTSAADVTSVNLASGLTDGEQLVVGERGQPRDADGGVAAGADDRVRVNRAGVDRLQQLPGVGPVLARRIADYRDAHGPFGAVEDLLDVPGIGEGRLADMRDHIALP